MKERLPKWRGDVEGLELSAKFLKTAFEIKTSQRDDWETPSLS